VVWQHGARRRNSETSFILIYFFILFYCCYARVIRVIIFEHFKTVIRQENFPKYVNWLYMASATSCFDVSSSIRFDSITVTCGTARAKET
jgi:hypothetical protein